MKSTSSPLNNHPFRTLWACAFGVAALLALAPSRQAQAAGLIECTPGSYGTQLTTPTSGTLDDGSFALSAAQVAAIFPSGIPLINNYTVMYVNINGNVTFQGAFSNFTPDGFPGLTQPTIGAYFGDVDLRAPGTGQPALPAGSGLFLCQDTTNKRFIITWKNVGYYAQKSDKLSSFQMILTDTLDTDPCTSPTMGVEFRYERLEWNAGDVSGGAAGLWVGPSGAPAAAGIDAGDGVNLIELTPWSKTTTVLDLVNQSNIGQPGVFRYNVAQGTFPICGNSVVNLCEACDDGNTSNTDACTNLCNAAVCGDGFVRSGTETCDLTAFASPVSCPTGYSGTALCNNNPANPSGNGTCTVDAIPDGCTDNNECTITPTICGAGTCNNTPGAYTCACPTGYTFNGTTCADVNECVTNPTRCGVGTCSNSPGSFSCACPTGYTFNGTTCADVNECTGNPTLCGAGTCNNNPGGYTCACPTGYTFNGTTCADVNECVTNPTRCGVGTCNNSPGSFSCSCPTGYTFNGTTCADVNECTANPTLCGAGTCNNNPGGYTCACPTGYTFNGTTCADVNECTANPVLCDVGTCNNNPGGYTCACPTGYTFNGTTCADVNECTTNPVLCGAGTCSNNGGGYTCACDPGYAFNGTTCANVDGCITINCGPGTCVDDLPPSLGYTCTCNPGYTFDGTACADVDECALNPVLCGPGTCADIDGAYTCACDPGYAFDGAACTDVDECAANPVLCGPGTCADTDGAYTCACDPGYSFDGVTCTDTDGCAANPCFAGVTCTDDLPPSTGFVCGPCPNGFAGDGQICDLIPGAVAIQSPADGDAINDTQPVLTGLSDPGAEVSISIDGQVVGTATADASGNWTYTVQTPLTDATYTFTATVTSGALIETDTATIEIDTVAPSVSVQAPQDGSLSITPVTAISGDAEPGAVIEVFVNDQLVGTATADAAGVWSLTLTDPLGDGAYALRVTATDDADNTSQETTQFDVNTDTSVVINQPLAGSTVRTDTPTVSGVAVPGATLTIYVNGQAAGTVTADANGDWTWTPDAPLAEGSVTVRVVAAVDGVDVGESSVDFGIDLSISDIVIDQPAPGSITSDPTPTFSGSAEPGAEVVILAADGTVLGTVTADSNGAWTWTPTDAFVDGEQTFTVRATDTAGNSTEATVTVTIDTVPPVLDVLSPVDEAVIDSGPVVINGTGEAGSTVEIFVGDTSVGTVTVGEDGTWSYTLPEDPANGPQTIRITATDEAGNTTVVEVEVTVEIGVVSEDVGDTTVTSDVSTEDTSDTATATQEDTSADTSGGSEDTSGVADTSQPNQLVGGCSCDATRAPASSPRSSVPAGAAALLVGFALVVVARRRSRR